MFRRVLCGLALVAMMGTVAFGAPVVTVTNAVVTSNGGPFTENVYSPAPPEAVLKDSSHLLYFFVEGLDTAETANNGGVGSTQLASFGFHMEESGSNLSFANPQIFFNETEIFGFGWLPRTGFSGNFEDLALAPDVNGDEDWGWSVFSGTSAAVGGGVQFLGTLEMTIAPGPGDPEDFLLELEPARAPAPADTTMTQTLIEFPGAQPGDVVTNVMWAGMAKTNLIPEPTTMALLLAGFGGSLVARRRRS